MMNVISEIERIIKQYGIYGTGDLEYICLLVHDGMINSVREYREPKKCQFYQSYASTFEQHLSQFMHDSRVQACDYSAGNVNHLSTKRITFLLPPKMSTEDVNTLIEKFMRKLPMADLEKKIKADEKNTKLIFQMKYSPLTHLGLELWPDGTIATVKYYLSLRPSQSETVRVNDIFFSKYEKLMTALDASIKAITINNVSTICAYKYRPLFMGVNAFADYLEYKIYFLSDAYGRNTSYLRNEMKSLVNLLGLHNEISEQDINQIYNLGLYIRGMAYSLTNNNWRLYFHSLPLQKI